MVLRSAFLLLVLATASVALPVNPFRDALRSKRARTFPNGVLNEEFVTHVLNGMETGQYAPLQDEDSSFLSVEEAQSHAEGVMSLIRSIQNDEDFKRDHGLILLEVMRRCAIPEPLTGMQEEVEGNDGAKQVEQVAKDAAKSAGISTTGKHKYGTERNLVAERRDASYCKPFCQCMASELLYGITGKDKGGGLPCKFSCVGEFLRSDTLGCSKTNQTTSRRPGRGSSKQRRWSHLWYGWRQHHTRLLAFSYGMHPVVQANIKPVVLDAF